MLDRQLVSPSWIPLRLERAESVQPVLVKPQPSLLTSPVSPRPRAGGEGRRRSVVTPATADDGSPPPPPKKKSFKSIDCKSFCQCLSHGEPDQRKQTVSSASEHVLVWLSVRLSVSMQGSKHARQNTSASRSGNSRSASRASEHPP